MFPKSDKKLLCKLMQWLFLCLRFYSYCTVSFDLVSARVILRLNLITPKGKIIPGIQYIDHLSNGLGVNIMINIFGDFHQFSAKTLPIFFENQSHDALFAYVN
jgi:hypothetical protein